MDLKDEWKYEPYPKWQIYAIEILLIFVAGILLLGAGFALFGGDK